MSGAVQGSASQTALMIAHSASVSSVLVFGIVCRSLAGNISTVVEDVNNNLYKCREWRGRRVRARGLQAGCPHAASLVWIVGAGLYPEYCTLLSSRDSSVRSAMYIARPPEKVMLQLR